MPSVATRKPRAKRVTKTPPAEPQAAPRLIGKYERLAHERHARDLALCAQPGGHPKGFWFDEAAADRVVQFIERFCHHYQGEWAGQPMLLQPWQKFCLRVTYGWKNADGSRRFRTSYREVARKNGKSQTAAAEAAYLLIADGEEGAQIFSTATKEDQAKIAWEATRQMVRRSPDLARWVETRQKSLLCERTTSFFRPLGSNSDTLDGLNPHGHVCDEMHAHKDRGIWDVMLTAMGARVQPMTLVITTAGVYDSTAIGWELHEHAQQVLDGVVEDDSFFAIIFAIDEGDDWRDPEVWGKANPNLGVSVYPAYMAQQCLTAQQQPTFLNTFLRLHLNVWTQQVTRWISVERWNECGGVDASLEDFRGRHAYLGLDLSTKLDISALAIDIPEDEDRHRFFWRFYVPEELVRQRAQDGKLPDYAAWVREGWLTATPGNVIDYDFIRRDILALRSVLKIRQLAYDPWNATQLITQLAGDGFKVEADAKQEQLVEMRQGFKTLSEPSKVFETLVMSGRLAHGKNPVMRWMVDNAAIRHDANENIAPDKRSATGKIDGLVASIMALGRAISEPPPKASVYESRGVRSF